MTQTGASLRSGRCRGQWTGVISFDLGPMASAKGYRISQQDMVSRGIPCYLLAFDACPYRAWLTAFPTQAASRLVFVSIKDAKPRR